MAGERVRLGVIGLGLIWQAQHRPNLAALSDRFRVVHVCDLSPALARSSASALLGDVRASTDWRAVCADPEVDAILLLTPGDHTPQVRGALEADKHVLVEKPLSFTVGAAKDLERVAVERNRVLQVSYMKMYDPIIERARGALATVGARRLVRVTVLHPADSWQTEHLALERAEDVDRGAARAAEREAWDRVTAVLGDAPTGLQRLYLSPLLTSVCHELSVLRALEIPLPSRFLAARAWPFDPSRPGDEPPTIEALADIGSGTVLSLVWAWLPDYPEYFEELAVYGTAGRVHLSMPAPYLGDARAALRVERLEPDGTRSDTTLRASRTTGFRRSLEAFADSIQAGATVRSTASGAAADLACLQQLVAAVAAGDGFSIRTEGC